MIQNDTKYQPLTYCRNTSEPQANFIKCFKMCFEWVKMTFSVGFRTTPMDNTGVSHILEHTTLCGSEKFPCRDPFFSMLTRSLSTYMNAWTGWCNSDYFCLMVGCTNTAKAGNDLLGCVSRGRAPNLSR